eukprot:CAMPEP_0168539206 /NCGR_PEP_ID=MMETSP0405-20121227/21682_1 /TAXON_ID=498012 /ORGANISM="Trichosphaerium sp, Strain Am-I-7 wt" /LENGTH=305 /DNA_ID=CAMNT_0008568709 /DNA_START=26 /DNA_END=940 /DNA_ORIENTATION=+
MMIFNYCYYLKKTFKGWPIIIVFNKVKAQVGGRMEIAISGGAALNPEIQEFMSTCFDIHILQGYGLTETCGPVSVQEISDMTFGTVGAPTCSTKIKLVSVPNMGYNADANPPRGEIQLAGHGVATHYYKNEEKTEEAFTSDGWFKTGDIGEWTPQGTLKIIDRIKNLIKPTHGEYISLDRLESIYRKEPLAVQFCLYVDSSRYHCVALIVPEKSLICKWATENKIEGSYEELCKNDKVKKYVLTRLQTRAKQDGLKSIELVRGVFLSSEPWTPENELLTASLKLQRRNIKAAFNKEIEEMYAKLG